MYLYHGPLPVEHARSIVATGFRDEWGYYQTDRPWRGVWLSDKPAGDGADAGGADSAVVVVRIDLSVEQLVEYEWRLLEQDRRTFLLPAALLNQGAVLSLAPVARPES